MFMGLLFSGHSV